VNIDFGTVIRFLAGLDSITQAAGRCNRNNYRTSGTVLIINPADENLDYLHVIRRAKAEAERVLDEYQADPSSFDYDILGTKAMNRYYHYYFFSQRNKMSYPIYKKDIDYDSDLFSLLSTNTIAIQAYARKHNHQEPVFRLRQSFRKAGDLFEVIDAPTKGVIVPYKEGEGLITDICASVDPDKTKLLLRKAQRYAVNLFPWQVNALNERGLIKETAPGSGIQYLDGKCYDGKETGLDIETSGEIPLLNA
jgi:CRISPR-associated endonuclease/helicase Cas3